ncbi:MAG TPA: DUF1345 domain-containing protein [Parafilimonas sp.]|nr:DUF1345 domain-containing protein [Parafilimonas sp.]
MSSSSEKKRGNIFLRMHSLQRVIISIVLAVITFFIALKTESKLIEIVSLWSVFALTYLIMSWIVLFTKPIEEIKKTAAKDDGSAPYVFIMILLSSCGSMFMVLLLLISNDVHTSKSGFLVPITVAGMLLSWVMVHTLFAFHYAHDYYGPDINNKTKHVGGLDFPGNDDKPDYIDFVYFSFVIGCTFQVSDIEITSRKIRRLVLVHQLIAFGLNTFVLALSINLVASLSK